MSEPFAPGSLVEITEAVVIPPFDRQTHVGDQAFVESYVSAEESDDGVAFYWLDNEDGTDYGAIDARLVRLVKTPEELQDLELPTALELLQEDIDFFRGELIEDILVDAARETVQIWGHTEEGLRFSAVVMITELRRA